MAYKNPEDQKRASREHYQRNKEKYYIRNAKQRDNLREILREAKNVPCHDCGQRHPFYVMQFDHIGDDKEYTIAHMISLGNKQKMLDEIAKCEVVCANCHAVRTFTRAHTGIV